MKSLFKRLFCNHDYKMVEECLVHHPDYEPHKIGVIYMCKHCGKEKRDLYLPHTYIENFGKYHYDKIIKRTIIRY